MPVRIKPKRSTTAGVIPVAGTGTTQLDVGEIAVNLADRKIFANNAGAIVELGSGYTFSNVLSTAVSSNVVARANIVGWGFSAIAGKTYRIQVVGTYQSAATTTGGSIGLVMATGAGTIHGLARMEVTQATGSTGVATTIFAINATNTTAGSFITSTGVSVINSPHSVMLDCVLNCTTSGTLNLQWGSKVAASAAQLNAGSCLVITQLN